MIELENVGIQFGSDFSLSQLSLNVADEESFVLIGPSGQGKSVLLKIIAGLLRPNQGSVSIHGHSLYDVKDSVRNEIMFNMGMLFQKNALFDSMTVGQNIAFPLIEVRRLNASQADGIVDKYLDAVGILHSKDLYPDEISGGMQKRLGIARALALSPKVVLYDDPTAGLDPITSRKIISLIQDMKTKQKGTIITITNDMNRAFELADRIGFMVDGELVITGTVEQTKKHPDPRVQQFISGNTKGPLTVMQ